MEGRQMKRLVLSGLIVFLAHSIWAQDVLMLNTLPVLDTISTPVLMTAREFAVQEDSIVLEAILAANLEYIPAEESAELIADRLQCVQQKIPLDYNDKVAAFINYFTIRDREYMRMVLRRKDVYFPLFEKYLAQYKLPQELKYLSIIESGLNPRAVSRARAVGLWQFMAGTGRYMGLHHDWYIDERMDPEKSTDAACRYLVMLHSIFKDWPLALAAYNSGPGTVLKAIRRSGYKRSFWDVYSFLPRETRAYVPQFIAIIYAVNYAELHNLAENTREELPAYDTLLTRQFLHFETFANLTGTCLEDYQKLNPSIQRNAVPDGKSYVIKVPVLAKQKLEQNRYALLDSASKLGRKQFDLSAPTVFSSTYGREMIAYQIRPGDALGTIAQRHHVRIDDVKNWNNLSSNLIHPGRVLNIWVLPPMKVTGSISYSPPAPVPPADATLYIVQPGDTLWDISRKFQGLTIEKIKTLNNLKTNKLKPGQKLIVS
jgi:membrane-bound lytic murein transglycosylase D